MAYKDLERLVSDPRVEVRAGPWSAPMGLLMRHGWRFEGAPVDYCREVRIVGRNPSSGIIGYFTVPDMFQYEYAPRHFFLPEDLVICNEHGLYREITAPDIFDDSTDVELGRFNRMAERVTILTPYDERESQEIIVTPDRVPYLLEEIRKAQEPSARELLGRQRRREEMEIPKELKQKAKILSFG